MPNQTETDSLTIAINDVREDITAIETGIEEMEASIPNPGTIEFKLADREEITGIRVQVRMDREYLTSTRGTLRRLERQSARRVAA